LAITEEVLANTRRTLKATAQYRPKNSGDMIEGVHQELTEYCAVGERVVDQARRRVLYGEQVPGSEKIYSIFEPHTDLIKRGKVNKPVEFGHKVFLAESTQGLITQYRVLKGNPSDEDHVELSLNAHRKTLGSVPEVFATDRGFDNEKLASTGADLEQVSLAAVSLAAIVALYGRRCCLRELNKKGSHHLLTQTSMLAWHA
jgi:IS5 family transposase